jgi:hypothetical protein
LTPDLYLQTIDQATSPGYLYMSVGLGTERDWLIAEPEWTLRQQSFRALGHHPSSFELHLHVR